MTDQKDTNNIKASYGELTEFPKMVFGVMGSAGGEVPKTVREKIYTLGAEVGRRGYTLITGVAPACRMTRCSERNRKVGSSWAFRLLRASPSMWSDIRRQPAATTSSSTQAAVSWAARTKTFVRCGGHRGRAVGHTGRICDRVRRGKTHRRARRHGWNRRPYRRVGQGHQQGHQGQGDRPRDPVKLVELLEEAYVSHVLPGYLDLIEGHNPDCELE